MQKMPNAKFPVSGKKPDQDNGYNSKVPVPASTSTIGRKPEQPMIGKLTSGDTDSMPGGKNANKGGAIKTIASQPVVGKNGNGTTAMGSGSVIPGKV